MHGIFLNVYRNCILYFTILFVNSNPCITVPINFVITFCIVLFTALTYGTLLDIKGFEIELSLLSYTKKPKHNITITNKVQLYTTTQSKVWHCALGTSALEASKDLSDDIMF